MSPPLLLTCDPAAPAGPALDAAVRRLRDGGLVAFPTETVYGLGANALDPDAVARIYAAKGRPGTNPLICHVADAATARHALVAVWPPAAEALATAFWPGPLTLVLPARAHVPPAVTAGTGTVGVRVPAHPVAQALLAAVDRPIAAPSANRSTGVSPTMAAHVVASLGAAAECVLDGGPSTVGIESAVLDLTGPTPLLLRPGTIGRAAIEAVIGPVADVQAAEDGRTAMRAPGQMARHYAPATPLRLVPAGASLPDGPGSIGLLGRTADVAALSADRVVALPDAPEAFARELYAALHVLDASGCDRLLVVAPPGTPDWAAVHDRLRRAAAPA